MIFIFYNQNWRTPEGQILKKPIEITAPLPPYFKKKSELLFGIDAESTEWDYQFYPRIFVFMYLIKWIIKKKIIKT